MMNNEIINSEEKKDMIQEIQDRNKMCEALLQSPHYKKIGPEGIYAIVEKAKSVGVSPLDALNGGMYYVQGKVEMTSFLMNQLIRSCGHNISKDTKNSNDTICILHGKRADNGDTWIESFSIDDAKRAGIYRNQWIKYPRDMLFARALSRLARQLFPDVIKGCYVQGEIAESMLSQNHQVLEEKESNAIISDDQYEELEELIGDNLLLRQNILSFMKRRWDVETLQKMPLELYEHALRRATEESEKREESKISEEIEMEA
jgi:hypothetical protein